MAETRQTEITRAFDFVPGDAQPDGRIPVVVSTDAVVNVADGPEMLVHTPDAVDMSRAPLPIIAGHHPNQVNIGVIEDMMVSNGQMRGMAKFGSRAEAQGYAQDVKDKVLRSVSAKYRRMQGYIRKSDKVLVTTRWMPVHAAIVAEPADINAGFYRSADGKPAELQLIDEPASDAGSPPAKPATTPKGAKMAEQENAQAGATAVVEVAERGTTEQRMTPTELETQRKKAITNLCSANRLDNRFAQRWIADGTSLEKVADEMLEIMAERGRDAPPVLGLTKKEVEQYSVMRAINAAGSRDWSKAGFELECSKSVGAQRGIIPRSAGGFFIPMDVQVRRAAYDREAQRDLTVAGTGSTGSNYLVSTENQPGNFIELLRNDSVVLAMGATRLTGLVGNITIPRMTAGGTAYWLADETTQITESQATIGQLSLSPKEVAALTQISHKLMMQSTPDVESMTMRDLAAALALAVDVTCLRGTGLTGQPHGIVGTTGLGTFDTDATDTFGDVLDAQVDVMAANALRPGCAYVADGASAKLLMGRSRFANTDTPVWNGSLLQGVMAGFPCRATNQMEANTMLFGWWPSIIVAEWGQLELVVNPFSDETRGLSSVRAWYSIDTGMRYPAAFSYDATVA